jgi:hypothetical protein
MQQAEQMDVKFEADFTPNMLLARTVVRLQAEIRKLSHRVAALECPQVDDDDALLHREMH